MQRLAFIYLLHGIDVHVCGGAYSWIRFEYQAGRYLGLAEFDKGSLHLWTLPNMSGSWVQVEAEHAERELLKMLEDEAWRR